MTLFTGFGSDLYRMLFIFFIFYLKEKSNEIFDFGFFINRTHQVFKNSIIVQDFAEQFKLINIYCTVH